MPLNFHLKSSIWFNTVIRNCFALKEKRNRHSSIVARKENLQLQIVGIPKRTSQTINVCTEKCPKCYEQGCGIYNNATHNFSECIKYTPSTRQGWPSRCPEYWKNDIKSATFSWKSQKKFKLIWIHHEFMKKMTFLRTIPMLKRTILENVENFPQFYGLWNWPLAAINL